VGWDGGGREERERVDHRRSRDLEDGLACLRRLATAT
jgi:hypothetical protein